MLEGEQLLAVFTLPHSSQPDLFIFLSFFSSGKFHFAKEKVRSRIFSFLLSGKNPIFICDFS
jgi:hypothetical protein